MHGRNRTKQFGTSYANFLIYTKVCKKKNSFSIRFFEMLYTETRIPILLLSMYVCIYVHFMIPYGTIFNYNTETCG